MNGLRVVQFGAIALVLAAYGFYFAFDWFKRKRGAAPPSDTEKKLDANWVSFRRAICFFAGFLFIYAAVNSLVQGDASRFTVIAFAMGLAAFWVGANGLKDGAIRAAILGMIPRPTPMASLPSRTLTWSRSIVAFFLIGVLVALVGDDWLSGTAAANAVASAFPVLRAIANSSADPGFWLTYFTIMIGLHLCFAPVAAFCLGHEVRERPLRFIPWQIAFAAFFMFLLWFSLTGAMSGDSNSLHLEGQYGGGAALTTFLTRSRLGLALIGSAYMSMTYLFFSAGFIAMPIAMFKAATSGRSWRE
jgi:hypothetical protein